ncbi:formate dehydrogenase accessory sulfurtransferase FdhD [Tundrisphaera sp. TA3]|uniref:formate dehydrogenase accessory sulfurtransferase FdhD n=1 Tax=Tundrisphaera sp. TA3 TaxID=3435775 RepID=UPI003EBC7549
MSRETFPPSLAEPREERPPAPRDVAPLPIVRYGPEAAVPDEDWVAVEEPLEIRARGPGQVPVSVAVTMRTPGHDLELAVGFLFTEGLIRSRDELDLSARHLIHDGDIVRVALNRPFDGEGLTRHFYATSSCGVCGKASLDKVAVICHPVGDGPVVGRSTIVGLPDALRSAQSGFDRTGGVHAAGLFDAEGGRIALREDVGRHNAVDKIVGRALLDGMVPLGGHILMVSGRTSFEILQKAAVAGVPIVCAVSAPSSLAVAVADRLKITLVGFLRGSRFNVYTHAHRIDPLR